MNADNGPVSIDLAHEADFSVGPLRVQPSLRQAASGAESETLEPRVMQVLVALARRAGQVVSRDDLVQSCWAGRVVGDDAISRVIARVRKLGETHAAFSLETIPRVGYRLMPQGEVAVAEAPVGSPSPAELRESPLVPLLKRPAAWLAAGGVAIALLLAVIVFRPQSGANVDDVVARLTERLQQERAAGDMTTAGNAMRQLGSSDRPEERSAFAALASDDGEHALDILEDLAKQLEASGDIDAAAQAYRRLGAIAPLFDPARAVAAQRKAFELRPDSLASFQSLFFITLFQGEAEMDYFVRTLLEDRTLPERMRGWVLAHRAFLETDMLGDTDRAEATLAELKALKALATDPVLQAAATWAEAVIAFNKGEMARSQTLAEAAQRRWASIPEKTSDSAEIILFRIRFERGDWRGAFEMGSQMFDRRSREGDLFPAIVGWTLCEGGMIIGETERALPYCQSSVRRNEGPSARVKGYAGMVATVEGDAARAAKEFELARALVPGGGSVPASVLIYEAWATARSGDIATARRILAEKPGGRSWEEATRRRPAINAMAKRLEGEWLIAAGQPRQACAPLADAVRIYAAYGGDAGRDAVQAVQAVAGCPA
jgi:DNA-binding winged helix-turn-helix (wHTH) protein/tetratricopeptide (TPR) repeat protein